MTSKVVTLKLQEPIEVGGTTIAEVTIRRPKVKDLRALDQDAEGTEMEKGIAMAALLTDLTPDAIEEMDAFDFAALSEKIAGFLPQAPAQGAGGA